LELERRERGGRASLKKARRSLEGRVVMGGEEVDFAGGGERVEEGRVKKRRVRRKTEGEKNSSPGGRSDSMDVCSQTVVVVRPGR